MEPSRNLCGYFWLQNIFGGIPYTLLEGSWDIRCPEMHRTATENEENNPVSTRPFVFSHSCKEGWGDYIIGI